MAYGSLVLLLYGIANRLLRPFASAYLEARARRGKEDPERLGERFGRYVLARPEGALLWLHAASVGESGVALALIETIAARQSSVTFLLTTGTRTSADLVARRAPPRTVHAYAPIDARDCVRRFLDHWRPDAGVFVESELWPNLILESERRGVKLALVNARMSPRSLRRWARWRAAGRRLIGAFSHVSAADTRTREALTALRPAAVGEAGNLKLAAPAPRVDAAVRSALVANIGDRPVWLAASTHLGEDEIVLAAHEIVRRRFPEALLIIAPRHPERGSDIASRASHAPLRSRGDAPTGGHPCYVADTLGELGALYSVAPVSLIAGSLLPALKGHNPIEPAQMGSAILTGPFVESFDEVFRALFAAKAATQVDDAAAIAEQVVRLLNDDVTRQRQAESARDVVAHGADAFERAVSAIETLIPAQRSSSHATA